MELARLPLDSNEKLILVAVLAAIMIFVVFFEMRMIRGKNKEIKRVSQRKDEAYNAILTTRTVMNVMQRQGTDVTPSSRLLASAKLALQRGDYDGCMDLCQKSRDELTMPGKAAKETPEAETAEAEHLEEVAAGILSADRVKAAETYAGTKLTGEKDGSYLSAKFEINTAKADLRRAVEKGKDTNQAQTLLTEAESAFVSGNYTKALSSAVKARKAVNEKAAEDTIRLESPSEEKPEPEVPAPPEETELWECGSCGAGLDSDDAFCHKCGAKVEKERSCSICGTKPRPDDTFCRKCGAKVD